MSSSAKLSRDAAGIEVDPTLYQSMISSLLYLTASRPDIAFSVEVCARFQAAPKESHLTAVKQIIRYVNDTSDYGIWYSRDSNECLARYSDDDWAECIDDRKSTTGGCFYIGNNLVSWMSKKQNSVSLSTAEAEYIAVMSPFKCSALKGSNSKGKEQIIDVDEPSPRSKRTRFSTEVYDLDLFRSYAAFQNYRNYFLGAPLLVERAID
ncbi:secreted RxLR effector protein 161-like [Quercus suber]|uniref:secreted RxLR effector protein 161-like n=1 Tax=Quercus suber TaxID=58331 RepID=UPI0032DFAABA